MLDGDEKRDIFNTKRFFTNKIDSQFYRCPGTVVKISSKVISVLILEYFVDESSSNMGSLKELTQIDNKNVELKITNVIHSEIPARQI